MGTGLDADGSSLSRLICPLGDAIPPLLTPGQTDNISPSIDGPLCSVKKMAQSGKFGPGVGGKARVHGHMLATKGSDGQTGNVPVRTHRSLRPNVALRGQTDRNRHGALWQQPVTMTFPSRA
jgi:hypothetical protein